MAVEIAGKSPKQLLEERAGLIKKAQDYHEQHESAWTSENESTFDEMMSDVKELKAAAERKQKLEGLTSGSTPSQLGMTQDPSGRPDRADFGSAKRNKIQVRYDGGYRDIEAGARGSDEYQDAFRRFLRSGRPQAGLIEGGSGPQMALQSDNAEQAGYLLASEQFAAEMLKEVDDLLHVRRRARIHTVREADSLGIRARTSKASTFAWSAELEVSTEDSSLKYGKRILRPQHLTGMIKVSRDLLRRSLGGVEAEVRFEMARDAGEVMEDAYLTGTGDRQPLGVFTASSDGISTSRDVVTGSNTNFTADGLLDAKYALKSQYRNGARGELSWMFHRDGINKIAKLKDNDGQYLLRVGLGFAADNGMPEDLLLGFPVDESERAPNTFTAGNYVGILANWRYYEIADALDMEMQSLFELYASTNQVGYIGRVKTDGMPTLEEAFVRLKCGT